MSQRTPDVNALGDGMNPDVRGVRRVALAGIAASVCLAALNLTVGIVAHSTSVFATGVEFAGDVFASALVLVGVIVAVRPADDNHPYGHGRIEALAAFVVGLVLIAGGAGISWTSLQAVGERHAPPTMGAVAALVTAIAVRAIMSGIKFRVGRRARSASLVADAWNDTVDILSATSALIAVGLTMYDADRFLAADHYGGFGVGLIVMLTGLRVLRDASFELMDTMPSGAMIERVRAVAASVPGVVGVDKCRARKTGFHYHVDLHIEVDPGMTVAASHQVAGQVRSEVRRELGWVADVLVHVEPAGGKGN